MGMDIRGRLRKLEAQQPSIGASSVMIFSYTEAGCESEAAFEARLALIPPQPYQTIFIMAQWYCAQRDAGVPHSHMGDGYIDCDGKLVVP
jgi:hypothetical protein